MFGITIKNKEELYSYLKTIDINKYKTSSLASVYFLIQYNSTIEPIYFTSYKEFYFESPCCLIETFEEKYVKNYVNDTYLKNAIKEALEYEQSMCRNGKHYEIDCPQCTPFLKFPLKIIKILTEQECLDFLLIK